MIRLEGVAKRFGTLVALDDVNLTVETGQRLCVTGPSGTGKTTLLRLIAGFETPDRGEIHLNGRLASDPRIRIPPQERGVSMVFQGLALWPHMRVRRQLEFVLAGLSAGERKRRCRELIGLMELDHREDAYPSELSGGEQQRLAIARALATPNPALLLDEPLRSLDEELRARVAEVIGDHIEASGATVICATQQPAALRTFVSEVVKLEEGMLR